MTLFEPCDFVRPFASIAFASPSVVVSSLSTSFAARAVCVGARGRIFHPS